MGRRFSDYKRGLFLLYKVGQYGQTNATKPTLIDDSPMANYLEYTQGLRKPNITDTTRSGGLRKVGLYSFLHVQSNLQYTTKISKRVVDEFAKGGSSKILTPATYEHITATPLPPPNASIIPAKCILRNKLTTATNQVSGITGLPYKKSSNDSWTVPFGSDSIGNSFATTIGTIGALLIANANTKDNGVRFVAEKHRAS